MKKLVLTIVALVAVATSSFAQFSNSDLAALARALSSNSSCVSYNVPSVIYNVPSVSYSVPSVSYSVPSVSYSTPVVNTSVPKISQSTINALTTTVSGYTRSNGTYVDSYVRTMPNTTNWDNFSTKGNSNPFTGSTGYKARDYSSDAYNYGAGHTIYTGSRGGQYYINSNGNKTYVPKR